VEYVLYRHFLTPAQYRSRFAPSAASVAAVGGYLRAAGLRIAPVPGNHLYVRASGTVDQTGLGSPDGAAYVTVLSLLGILPPLAKK
jgi:hypothetical protein